MSFGSVQSAITSLKNNRKLLNKRNRSKKGLSFEVGKNAEFNTPVATPKQIKKLREKLKQENKKRNIKLAVILSAIAIICISIILSL